MAAIVYPKAMSPPRRRTLTSNVILGDIINGLSVTHSWKQQAEMVRTLNFPTFYNLHRSLRKTQIMKLEQYQKAHSATQDHNQFMKLVLLMFNTL